MVGFHIYSEKQDSPVHSGEGWGKDIKVWGLILPFIPVLDIIFFAAFKPWFRSPSDVYPRIMCFEFLISSSVFLLHSHFPRGRMYVWLYMTHCQAYGALNKYCYNDEWRILDHLEFITSMMVNFSVLRGPMTPCLFPVLPDGATSSSACCEHILVVKNWDPNPSKRACNWGNYPCQFTLKRR